MNKLQAKFEKLYTTYQERRAHFKATIQDFTSWGTKKLRLRGLALLEEADVLARELREGFAVTAEGRAAYAEGAYKKVKRLGRVYKELHEMTKPWWRQWLEAVGMALFLALILRNFVFGLYHVPTGSAESNILVGDRIWGNKMAYFYSDVKRGDLVIFDNPQFPLDRKGTLNYYWQRYIGFPIPLLGLGTGPDNWVKRVIAVPGDTIEGRIEDGKTAVYLNGTKLKEAYVNQFPLIYVEKDRGIIPFDTFGPLQVPSFLRREVRPAKYSFDPSKSLDEQPFYKLRPEEVMHHPLTGQPVLEHTGTPSTDYNGRVVDTFGPYVIPPGKYWVMGDSRKNSVDSRFWMFLDESLVHGRASFIIYSIDSEEPFWLFELIKHPIDFWTRSVRYDRFVRSVNNNNEIV